MTETGYQRLKDAVERGDVEITLIDGPPRTVGSALFRSLSQFYDAKFYEAFHPNRGTFEEICSHISDSTDALETDHPPKRILIKSLPRHFSAENWLKMKAICHHFIYEARDPQLQMYSLLERNANDLHFEKKGAAGLSREEVWKYADKVGAWLQDGGERVGETNRGGSTSEQLKIQGDFSRAAWRDMDAHIDDAQHEIELNGGKKSLSLVSGFLLRTYPEDIMKHLLERLNLPSDESTLHKACRAWDNESKSSVYIEAIGTSAYTEPVRNSSGFTQPLEPTPTLEQFPETTFRRHIIQTALPIYTKFLSNPYLIGRDHLKANMQRIVNDETFHALLQSNPVDVYAHAAAMNMSGTQATSSEGKPAAFSDELIRSGILNKLRSQCEPYSASFDVIDSCAKLREHHWRVNNASGQDQSVQP